MYSARILLFLEVDHRAGAVSVLRGLTPHGDKRDGKRKRHDHSDLGQLTDSKVAVSNWGPVSRNPTDEQDGWPRDVLKGASDVQ